MNIKTLVGALIVLGLGIGGFLAVRYTRAVGEQITSSPGATGASGKPRVRFVKNPKTVPELTMTTLDGKTITSKELAGKVVIYNFWATWCVPCRTEIPDLIKLQTQYKDQLVIIGVLSEDEPGPNVSRFAVDYKMNYPIVPETPELTAAFTGIYALPTTFMVGPDGRIMQKHVGQIRPAQIELETRVLAKLPVDAEVEFEPDDKEAVLASNARATEVPGVDLTLLTPEQKTLALNRLNDEPCTCGCGFTIAQCRINDSTCALSPKLAADIMAQVRGSK
jgi:thiol-disulfide isomerase/thioredoxin